MTKAAPASRTRADVAVVGSISGTAVAIKAEDVPRISNITAIMVRKVPPPLLANSHRVQSDSEGKLLSRPPAKTEFLAEDPSQNQQARSEEQKA
jgi:hypothetical protein